MSNEALVQRIADAVLMVVDQRDWSDWSDWSTSTCRVALADALRPVLASSDEAAVNYQTTTDRSALSAPEAEAVAWQYRMFIAEGDGDHGWSNWRTCREAFARGKVDDEFYQYRALYLHPAPAHSEQAAVPDGFVLVPKEPTQAMVDAGEGCPQAPWIITSPTSREKELHCITQYRAMLAAAPSAPAVIQQLTTAGDGWMPIETAPKDGTHAIVAKIGATDAIPQMGIEAKAAHVWWAVRGFWDDKHERWTDGLEHLVPPSHWIPMPAATESVPVRAVTPLSCPKCFARWLFWPSEQSGFGQDTLSLISPASCDYCEPAGSAELESLNRVKPTVTGIHLPAAPREPRT